jgi:hypothetical protein
MSRSRGSRRGGGKLGAVDYDDSRDAAVAIAVSLERRQAPASELSAIFCYDGDMFGGDGRRLEYFRARARVRAKQPAFDERFENVPERRRLRAQARAVAGVQMSLQGLETDAGSEHPQFEIVEFYGTAGVPKKRHDTSATCWKRGSTCRHVRVVDIHRKSPARPHGWGSTARLNRNDDWARCYRTDECGNDERRVKVRSRHDQVSCADTDIRSG